MRHVMKMTHLEHAQPGERPPPSPPPRRAIDAVGRGVVVAVVIAVVAVGRGVVAVGRGVAFGRGVALRIVVVVASGGKRVDAGAPHPVSEQDRRVPQLRVTRGVIDRH